MHRPVAIAAAAALAAHLVQLWELSALLRNLPDGGARAFEYVFAPALPFLALLTGLLVAGLVRWARLFPAGALAAPWLLYEAWAASATGKDGVLVGLLVQATRAAAAADLLLVAALAAGAALALRR